MKGLTSVTVDYRHVSDGDRGFLTWCMKRTKQNTDCDINVRDTVCTVLGLSGHGTLYTDYWCLFSVE
jgi:hypothetical protein